VTSLGNDRRGAAYVEFLIAIVPFIVFVSCVLQGVLLQFADLTVERAASAAARSAVVVLDDDPRQYRGEPRNLAIQGGARVAAIRRSASNVLAALPAAARAGLESRLTVAFPAGADSDSLRSGFGPGDMVTVRVSYRFPCGVPLARRIMCRGGQAEALMEAEASLPNQGARYLYAGGGR
jgi:hypothetical protein